MKISVQIKGVDELRRKLSGMVKDVDRKVVQPAINKVAEKARAEINRAIPQEYAVKTSEVRNAIDLRKAREGDLRAVISVFGSARRRGRSLNMIHFLAAIQAAGQAAKARGARVKKSDLKALARQLGFQIRRDGGLKKIDGAFIGNKGRTIFRRTGKGRLPIEPMQVIGFSQMFASQKISQRVINKIRAELPVEIDRLIKRVML